jgi:hypothetical protein
LREKGNDYGQISNLICEEAIELGVPDNVTLQIVNLRAYYDSYQRHHEID